MNVLNTSVRHIGVSLLIAGLISAWVAAGVATPLNAQSTDAVSPDSLVQHERIAPSHKYESTGQKIGRLPIRIILLPLMAIDWGVRSGLLWAQEDDFIEKSRAQQVRLRQRGLSFIFGGLGNGSGIGGGVRWSPYGGRKVQPSLLALASVWAYENYEFTLDFSEALGNRVGAQTEIRYNSRTRVDFYGLGQDTKLAERTDYHIESTTLAIGIGKSFSSGYGFTSRIGYTNNNLYSGQNDDVPSIEDEFAPEEVPGLENPPSLLSATLQLSFDGRNRLSNPTSGGIIRLLLGIFEDVEGNTYDYWNYGLELAGFLPVLGRHNRFGPRTWLAARLVGEVNDGRNDGEVPFFNMPIMGGAETPRGFRNNRYQDNGRVIFNLEHRWQIQTLLQAVLFIDEGQVFNSYSDFKWNNFLVTYGVGLRIVVQNVDVLRLELGKSREETRVFFSFSVLY